MIDFIEMFCGIGGFRLGLEKANKEDLVESYAGQHKAEDPRRRGSVGAGHNGFKTRNHIHGERGDTEEGDGGSGTPFKGAQAASESVQSRRDKSHLVGSGDSGEIQYLGGLEKANSEVSLEAKSRSGIEKGQHKSLSKRTRERTQFRCGGKASGGFGDSRHPSEEENPRYTEGNKRVSAKSQREGEPVSQKNSLNDGSTEDSGGALLPNRRMAFNSLSRELDEAEGHPQVGQQIRQTSDKVLRETGGVRDDAKGSLHQRIESRVEGGSRFVCVWANDWEYADFKWRKNKKTGKLEWKGPRNHSGKIYQKHWDDGTYIDEDIHTIDVNSIPDHDLLTAGFPCQSFSVAGKRKGFSDTRGTLFFEICRVIQAKRPKIILLENVRGLLSHDGGTTFQVILESLEDLGYWCEWQVFNSKHFKVPQNRERVFVIAHLRGSGGREVFPITESSDVIDGGVSKEQAASTSLLYWKNSKERWVQEDRMDSLALKGQSDLVRQPLVLQKIGNIAKSGHDSLWGRVYNPEGLAMNLNAEGGGVGAKTGLYLVDDKSKSIQLVGDRDNPSVSVKDEAFTLNSNPMSDRQQAVIVADRTRTYAGKGRNLESPKEISNALSGVQKDNLLLKGVRIRRLTPVECERLQAFPDDWTKYGRDSSGELVNISDTQRYHALGNAVTTNVIEFLGERIRDRCFNV